MHRWTAIIAGLGALGAAAAAALSWRDLAAEYHAHVLRADPAALESYLGAPEETARRRGLRRFLETPGGQRALCRLVFEAALGEGENNRHHLAASRSGILAITRKGIQSHFRDVAYCYGGGNTQLLGKDRERFDRYAGWLGEIEGLECRLDDPPCTVKVLAEAKALEAYHRAFSKVRIAAFDAKFYFFIEREAPETASSGPDHESPAD